MIALRFKRRLQPLRHKRFLLVQHVQKRFQLGQQLFRRLRLRHAAIKGIAEINLIPTQDIVEIVRHFVRAVFAIFKNRDIRRKNVFEFLVIAHIGNSAFYVSIQKEPTDLHIRLPL